MRQPLPVRRTSVPFNIGLGDTVGMLGMRRTGKTTLARRIYQSLLETYTDAVGYVIDSNASGDFSGWSGGYFGLDCPVIRVSPKGRQIVWQPPYDDREAYEDFFFRLYQARKPAVLLIDELSALGGGDKHDHYATLLKRARNRPNFPGITVITLSQEMAQSAKVPRQAFTQMDHFIKFYVQHSWDLAEANRKLNIPGLIQPEHEHGFWHAWYGKPPVTPKYYRGMEGLQ